MVKTLQELKLLTVNLTDFSNTDLLKIHPSIICNLPREQKNQWFVQKANKIHGHKYNYSKAVYVNTNTKVEIICPEHGSFWQEASSHLMGRGCLGCFNSRNRKSTEKFVKDSTKIHNSKYNYSKVVYISSKSKVEIICPHHGSFFQTPLNHLNGYGCFECGKENSLTSLKKARNKFKTEKISEINNNIKSINNLVFKNYLIKIKNNLSNISFASTKYQTPTGEWIRYTSSQNKSRHYLCFCLNCNSLVDKRIDAFNKNNKSAQLCDDCSNHIFPIGNSHIDDFISFLDTILPSGVSYDKNTVTSKNDAIILFSNGTKQWTKKARNITRSLCVYPNKNYQEELCYNLIKESIHQKVCHQYRIINSKGFNQWIDIAIPELRIAIEYNGEQHYNAWFNNKNPNHYEDIIRRDMLKAEWCIKNKWKLVSIRAKEVYSTNLEIYKNSILNEIIRQLNENIFNIKP